MAARGILPKSTPPPPPPPPLLIFSSGIALNAPSGLSRFTDTEAFLFGRFNFERSEVPRGTGPIFRLETIRRLLHGLENPHFAYPVLHVAGTKGKGSVVTLTAAILTAAGFRVGVYRSPHLESVRERICIAETWIGPEAFTRVIDRLRPVIAHLDHQATRDPQLHPPTFFEILTSAAMEHFREQRVDVAVFEVGMGGRLDSTNICQPLLTMITNVGLDHQRQLGATKAKIAAEKAGIIKPGVALLSGVRDAAAARVVAAIAQANKAPVYWAGRDFGSRLAPSTRRAGLEFSAWGKQPRPYQFRKLHVGMYGDHQVSNAAMAIAAAQWLVAQGWTIEEAAIRRGVHEAQIDGRFQIFPSTPPIVVDVAHNAMSARVFAAALEARFPECQRRVLIFSASKDKRIQPMLRILLPHFQSVVVTAIHDHPRAAEMAAMSAAASQAHRDLQRQGKECPARVDMEPDQAKALARALSPEIDLVAICGSVFLAGQMLPLVRQLTEGAASHGRDATLVSPC